MIDLNYLIKDAESAKAYLDPCQGVPNHVPYIAVFCYRVLFSDYDFENNMDRTVVFVIPKEAGFCSYEDRLKFEELLNETIKNCGLLSEISRVIDEYVGLKSL